MKAIRDPQVFYVEPRTSEGENTLEGLLEIVQKALEDNFVTTYRKWQGWKTEMEKFNGNVERLVISEAFFWHKIICPTVS